jgi:acetamidase/formamidase
MRQPYFHAIFWSCVAAVACSSTLVSTQANAQQARGGQQESAVHEIVPLEYFHTFFHKHPVLKRIKPGELVKTKTLDAGGQDEKDVHRAGPGNPLSGPFSVEGAVPGDGLVIHFKKVRPNRNWGFTTYRLLLPALTPDSIEGLYPNRYKDDLIRKGRANLIPWDIDIEKGTVRLREPTTTTVKLEFPMKPMLGCVGVAPAGDFAPTSGPSGTYGGNLDYNEIGEGSTVMLPVYHPGALLFIGDGHALQADGEPTGTGVEISMDVEFTTELRKGANLTGPRVETTEHIISIGSQPEFASSLDRGLQLATSDMVNWLIKDYGIAPWAAHLLIGYQGQYDVVTVAGSMALKVPKKTLPARK